MSPRNLYLAMVDAHEFRKLFIDELGWTNPDRPIQTLTDDSGTSYTFTQIAGFKGLRIWHCSQRPSATVQRQLDQRLAKESYERLIIFTDANGQDWRWPRRTGANARLLTHTHRSGEYNPNLIKQLTAIAITIEQDPTLVELLERMRGAFDEEAEKASEAASRLMRTLYAELDDLGIDDNNATLLLARLLFLMFGDDSEMWPNHPNLVYNWLLDHTKASTLHTDLNELFTAVDRPPADRGRAVGDPLAVFPHINGGLFEGPVRLKRLTTAFRDALLAACEFDWQVISPAVFGSMFQTVKDRAARRAGGEHYTTEENILRTINPLFLDDLRERLARAWNDKGQLTRLHNHLGQIRMIDPACGCGNFLVVAYREMRAIELEIIKRREHLDSLDNKVAPGRKLNQPVLIDFTKDLKVTLNHFYGIEIEPWPARIAETAMLLTDHLANQRMADDLGTAPDRLPIRIAPKILNQNALRTDWRDLTGPSETTFIVGNPPFGGDRRLDRRQKVELSDAWGGINTSHLDYVTAWYAKAMDYYDVVDGRWAFVSTNSICQGEPAADLWDPIFRKGWRCRFAHRSFRWTTEVSAQEGAVVHVSIVGFDRATSSRPRLWTYPEGGQGEATQHLAGNINPYLLDAPNILVRTKRDLPMGVGLPEIMFGNMPRTKAFTVTTEQVEAVRRDPIAKKYLLPYIGTDELLYDKPRWCLWLESATKQDMQASPILRTRIAQSRTDRLDSKAEATRRLAATPHLFAQRTQPPGPVLIIPRVVSEHRRYFTPGHGNQMIVSDSAFCAADADGYAFAILSSAMFMAWMRGVGGRLESRPRFSKEFTYNTFPLPKASAAQHQAIVTAGEEILKERNRLGGSIADLYTPGAMPVALVEAHRRLDTTVDAVFQFATGSTELGGAIDPEDDLERQRYLLELYARATPQPFFKQS